MTGRRNRSRSRHATSSSRAEPLLDRAGATLSARRHATRAPECRTSPRPHLRAVLHDEGAGEGNRARAVDRVRHRQSVRRNDRGRQRGRAAARSFTITLPAAGRHGRRRCRERRRIVELLARHRDDPHRRGRGRRSHSRAAHARGARLHRARRAQRRTRRSRSPRAGSIDVLLTDIVMPHTSGPQLVAKYLAERPAPLVIYMSGYADDALVAVRARSRRVSSCESRSRRRRSRASIRIGARRARRGAGQMPRTEQRLDRCRRQLTAGLIAMSTRPAVHSSLLGARRYWRAARAASRAPKARLLLQGILDGEGWSTNDVVQPAHAERRTARGPWAAPAVGRRRAVRALGALRAGRGRRPATRAIDRARTTSTATSSEFSYSPTPAFVVDAGRLTPLIGTFAHAPLLDAQSADRHARRLLAAVSARREGVRRDEASSTIARRWCRCPPITSATSRRRLPGLRPAIGGGITPIVGLRIGGSFTVGPYLNSRLARRSSPERVGATTTSASLRSTRRSRAAISRRTPRPRAGATTCRDARAR